ncbi:HesB/IscA family protein [Anaplasma bovis]|uniref:HesB/IscA family protein n=1 Tax=Anaplasma bovis TaxID=186733 RepID=UPI002FF247F6
MAFEIDGPVVTDCAIDKIKSVLERENFPAVLRVSVCGGGCAGFKYEFTTERMDASDDAEDDIEEDYYDDEPDDSEFDEEDDEYGDEVSGGSDLVLSDGQGVPILRIDSHSKEFLKNSTIDYVEDINGSRFVVNNPDAKFGCGCGNSFSL